MKKTYYIGIAVLALLITTAVVSITAFAFGTKSGHDWKAGHTWNGTDYTAKTQMADMTYEEWEEMMLEKVQTMRDNADTLESQITEENYETMQEIYQLMADGDMEAAKALMADFDMFGFGDKTGFKKGGYMMGGHWKKQQ